MASPGILLSCLLTQHCYCMRLLSDIVTLNKHASLLLVRTKKRYPSNRHLLDTIKPSWFNHLVLESL
ncbi:hypothetical protein FA13DRAFT_1261308 [Coprinellus micaceus]|uniref:Uncharacterized protein n=1 Tax=Coprinellus micaceus TaxID=71717 RepID=A0A4Y7SV04_COPMI|nr:hypothetical protein FA13DRAFT_1261308 [Coprinellus micaceus]